MEAWHFKNTMNIMKLHRVLFIVLPLITSCSGSMKYSPDQLQSAKFGEKYNAQIELKGGERYSSIVFIIQFNHPLLAYTIQKIIFLYWRKYEMQK